ncbi:MAG: mechanosensitive ion channel family protein, partial [Lachnospiraceae bacterium]|nr:mechanosensitive ion channel family protein [Lachnospiraceae bacterium]
LFAKVGIFVVRSLLSNYLVSLVFKYIAKKSKAVHLRFTKSAINVIIDVIAFYSLAQQFEMTKDISKVLLQSGSLILAIATFAAQQALGNVISGISLSVSKPYNVDEKIRVLQGGTVLAEGLVKDVTLRHTLIYQFNGETCIVPNSVMDSAVVINTNFTENIGNYVEIEIGYGADIEKAIGIMRQICVEHELTLNTEANAVTASGYTQNGVILKTIIWTRNLNDSFRACSDIRVALVREFGKCGIEIPYQTVTISNYEPAEKESAGV